MLCRLFMILLSCGFAIGAELPLAARFATAYEQELRGRVQDALSGYREVLSAATDKDMALAGRVLYRIGVCEQRGGRADEARKAWQELIRRLPGDSPLVPRAREAINALDREVDRFRIRGVVLAPMVGTNAGAPVGRAWVMAGEWGDEPPAVTDTNGLFFVDRRSAGQLADGRRYVLLYAEHPEQLLAGMAVVLHQGDAVAPVVLTVGMTKAAAGRVVDRAGRPVAGARIRIMGVHSAGPGTDAPGLSESGGEVVPVPIDRVLPPVVTDENGAYTVAGLIPGMRYVFTAEQAGYVLDRPVTLVPGPGVIVAGMPPWVLETMTMQAMGEVSLRGRVVDEMGRGIGVEIAVWTAPPVARQVAVTNSSDEGFFSFREVRENLVTLRVHAEGYLDREVPGLKPMGQDVDVVMKRGGGERGNAFAGMSAVVPKAETANATGGVKPFAGVTNGAERGNAFVGMSAAVPKAETANAAVVSGLRWLRGGVLNGDAVREEDLRGKVVVLRFSSAYVDASLNHQYPGEARLLTQVQKEFGVQDVVCIWVLPAQDDTANGRKLALEAGGEYPVAVDGRGEVGAFFGIPEQGGNVVIDRKGVVRGVCDAQQVFRVVKVCVREGGGGGW